MVLGTIRKIIYQLHCLPRRDGYDIYSGASYRRKILNTFKRNSKSNFLLNWTIIYEREISLNQALRNEQGLTKGYL